MGLVSLGHRRGPGPVTTRIEIAEIAYGSRGPIYRVIYDGEVLLEASRVPVFDACRALLAMGIKGRLEVWRPGKTYWDIATDIERGAGLTVEESDTVSVRIVPYVPFAMGAGRGALMSGQRISLPGFRLDKKTGRIVRDERRLSVSLRLQQRSSKRVRVRRGPHLEATEASTAAKGLDL
jgi:hypothetical protein